MDLALQGGGAHGAFTMTALPGTPAIQNAIPAPYFGTTPRAAPGIGVLTAAVMLGFGLWWLRPAEAATRRAGEGFGGERAGGGANRRQLPGWWRR